MTDIVERLRDRAKFDTPVDPYKLLLEAADFIESLRSRAEKAEAEAEHFYAFAVDDPGKNPPLFWKDRAEAAEATCEKLAGALLAAQEVVNVAEQMTSSRSDDEWIWGVQAKIKDALSEFRKEASNAD